MLHGVIPGFWSCLSIYFRGSIKHRGYEPLVHSCLPAPRFTSEMSPSGCVFSRTNVSTLCRFQTQEKRIFETSEVSVLGHFGETTDISKPKFWPGPPSVCLFPYSLVSKPLHSQSAMVHFFKVLPVTEIWSQNIDRKTYSHSPVMKTMREKFHFSLCVAGV